MSDTNDRNASPKRPHATLDLKATDVTPPEDGAERDALPPPSSETTGTSEEPAPEAAASEPSEPVAQAPAQQGSSFGRLLSHLAAGIVGGGLVYAGSAYLPLPGMPSPERTAQLEARLAALEDASKTGLSDALKTSNERLQKLEQLGRSVADLSDKVSKDSAALDEKIANSNARKEDRAEIAKLEERLRMIAEGANATDGRVPQLAAVTGKIADLENTIASQIAALRKTIPADVEARVAAAEEASQTAKSGTTRLDRDVAQLRGETAKLGQRAEGADAEAKRLAAAVEAAKTETGKLSSAVAELRTMVENKVAKPQDVSAAVAPVASKLSSLEGKLEDVVKSEDDRKANAERIVLALELGNLKRAIDRGQPYAAELQDVKKTAAGTKLDLSGLDKYKDSGIATLADLKQQFRPVIAAVLDADLEPADGSVLDRLYAGAKSIVRVRKVSTDPNDTSAEAVIGAWKHPSKQGSSPPSSKKRRPCRSAHQHRCRTGSTRCAHVIRPTSLWLKSRASSRPRSRARRQLLLNPHPKPSRQTESIRAMVRLVLYIAGIALVAAGLSWLADRPGTLLVTWQGYEIETSVFRAVVMLGVIVATLVLAWSIFRQIWSSPAVLSQFLTRRRQKRGLDAISSGMIAIGAGDRATAVRYAQQARKSLPHEPLTHLLRAQAAQLSGDKATARRIFEAMLASPETEQLGLRGLYVEAQREGEAEAQRQFAERALTLNPKLSWPVEGLFDLQVKAGDWAGALQTLAAGKKNGLIDKGLADRRRAVLLTAQAQALEEDRPDQALPLAVEAHALAPSLIPAAAIAGRILAAKGQTGKVTKIIQKTWVRAPHPELATAYAFARIGDSPRDRLVRVKQLAQLAPNSIESWIAVASAAIEAKDYDEARRALDPFTDERLTRRVATLLARIEAEESGDKGRAREWLARAASAPRDAAWTADGVVAERMGACFAGDGRTRCLRLARAGG